MCVCVTYYKHLAVLIRCSKQIQGRSGCTDARDARRIVGSFAHKQEKTRTTLGMEMPALER